MKNTNTYYFTACCLESGDLQFMNISAYQLVCSVELFCSAFGKSLVT
jgi:hypothetical protein